MSLPRPKVTPKELHPRNYSIHQDTYKQRVIAKRRYQSMRAEAEDLRSNLLKINRVNRSTYKSYRKSEVKRKRL